MKTLEEIDKLLKIVEENMGKYPGMSYMDGVKAAIEWVAGYSDEDIT